MHHRRLSIFAHRILTNPTTLRATTAFLHTQTNPTNPRTNGFAFFRFFSFASMQWRPPDPEDPATLIKEDGVSVCSQIWIENFREPNRTVANLSAYLWRFELWVLVYQKVCADEMGAYMPRSAIQRSALEDLLALQNTGS
ncbi:hypothetical protein L1049_001464 [Liquidambar formosana]|uniref:Uncharacterized protein n=1 Tax=Liquidambar formosana TaxID=63359 RepID=A0AAP0R8C4_LIQFO